MLHEKVRIGLEWLASVLLTIVGLVGAFAIIGAIVWLVTRTDGVFIAVLIALWALYHLSSAVHDKLFKGD